MGVKLEGDANFGVIEAIGKMAIFLGYDKEFLLGITYFDLTRNGKFT